MKQTHKLKLELSSWSNSISCLSMNLLTNISYLHTPSCNAIHKLKFQHRNVRFNFIGQKLQRALLDIRTTKYQEPMPIHHIHVYPVGSTWCMFSEKRQIKNIPRRGTVFSALVAGRLVGWSRLTYMFTRVSNKQLLMLLRICNPTACAQSGSTLSDFIKSNQRAHNI